MQKGVGNELYNIDVQRTYQQEILNVKDIGEYFLVFINPPHSALLFVPLSFFPLMTSFIIWTIILLLSLIGLVIMLWRLTRHWRIDERLLLISLCLAMPSLLRTFLLGTLSLWMLIILLAWYSSLKHGKDSRSAVMLILGSIKPQIVIGPALVYLGARRWKTISVFGFGAVAILTVTLLVFKPQIWIDYLNILGRTGHFYDQNGIYPTGMYNFRALLSLLLGVSGDSWTNLFSRIGFLISSLLIFRLWNKKWDIERPVFNLRIVFTLSLATFFNLHVYPQDILLLLLPGLILYEYLRQRDFPRKTFTVIALSCPSLFLLDEFLLSNWLPIRLAVFLMVIMLIWSGILLYRENRMSQTLISQ